MATKPIAIGAVGAGRMGRGIAIAFAASGHPVTLIDLKPRDAAALAALEASARAEIETDLDFLAGLGVIDAQAVAQHSGGSASRAATMHLACWLA